MLFNVFLMDKHVLKVLLLFLQYHKPFMLLRIQLGSMKYANNSLKNESSSQHSFLEMFVLKLKINRRKVLEPPNIQPKSLKHVNSLNKAAP